LATEIVSRSVALAQGLKRYFTGRPCKQGHVDERHTSSGTCLTCGRDVLRARYKSDPGRHRERSRKYRLDNLEKARAASRRYQAQNPEKRKAAVKRWRKANPEKVREINRRGSRAAKLRNPQAVAEHKRKWAAKPENKIARAAAIAAWRKANQEKCRAIVRNRRARAKGSRGAHTVADLAEILAAQGGRCAYCRADLRRAKKHVDHIMPLARGGSNARANLQYLCRPCNQTKNARDPIAFAQSIGLLI